MTNKHSPDCKSRVKGLIKKWSKVRERYKKEVKERGITPVDKQVKMKYEAVNAIISEVIDDLNNLK